MTDNELIAQVTTQNDHQAFAELVRRYQTGIRLFLRRLTAGDYHLADDIAQETFIQVFQKLHTFQGKGSFRAWVQKIAYHRFLRYLESGAVKNEVQQELAIDMVEIKDNVEADIMAEKVMSHLDVKERLVVTLNYSEGLSHSEIAELTELPLGSVKSLIQRARVKLQKLFVAQEHVA